MKTEHTLEPWEVEEHNGALHISQVPSNGQSISVCMLHGAYGLDRNNAKRIVAAVNACEGIPTEALEGGVIKELLDALKKIIAPENDHWKYRKKVTNLATAAIAKAERKE